MPESVYKVIELIGTSTESWEKAAKAAIERASETLRDNRSSLLARSIIRGRLSWLPPCEDGAVAEIRSSIATAAVNSPSCKIRTARP